MTNTIHFIITGGTIDSHFNPATDKVEVSQKTYLPEYMDRLKLYNPCEFTVVVMKDSRELNHKDRRNILEAVKKSQHKKIIITHGTYTMPDTGQYLKEQLVKNDKTIVLVGAMVPLTGFSLSDAPFNLGYAVANVQTLKPGVYICMNGKVFDPDLVDKNRIEGRFEEIKNSK